MKLLMLLILKRPADIVELLPLRLLRGCVTRRGLFFERQPATSENMVVFVHEKYKIGKTGRRVISSLKADIVLGIS